MNKYDLRFQGTLFSALAIVCGVGASVYSYVMTQNGEAISPATTYLLAGLQMVAIPLYCVGIMQWARSKGYSGWLGIGGFSMLFPPAAPLIAIGMGIAPDKRIELSDELMHWNRQETAQLEAHAIKVRYASDRIPTMLEEERKAMPHDNLIMHAPKVREEAIDESVRWMDDCRQVPPSEVPSFSSICMPEVTPAAKPARAKW